MDGGFYWFYPHPQSPLLGLDKILLKKDRDGQQQGQQVSFQRWGDEDNPRGEG